MKLAVSIALIGAVASTASAADCGSCTAGCLWTYTGGSQCFTTAVKESCDAWGAGYTWCGAGSSTTKPAATTTKPVATTTKPVATTTKPVATTAKPVTTTPTPTTAKPYTVKSKFTYSDKTAGNFAGTYQKVVSPATCSKATVSLNSPVGPMSEETTVVFRGPMTIYNIAVFDGSAGGDWKRVSSYSNTGTSSDLVFMNNKGIDYSGANKSPQCYSSADGLSCASAATQFGGKLSEASDPSNIYGGPGIATGAEVNIMRASLCDSSCVGYYDANGHHGWGGGKKMFVTKVMMPQGSSPNQPAIWALNAQIVRSNQYGCNCRGMGGVGGCGELDIAEVIETNAARDKVTTHYYFYDGSVPAGYDNFAARPTTAATTYLTIIDNSGTGKIKILEIGGNDFDFSKTTIAASQISAWLSA